MLGLGLLDGEVERLGVLGVGRLHRGEAAVAFDLLLHDGIAEVELVEQRGHLPDAGAVERRVDELDAVARFQHRLRLEHQRADGVAVDDVDLRLEGNRLARRLDRGQQRGQRRGVLGQRLEMARDAGGVRLDHLPAVGGVEFHAVVVRRIVAGGDHDAGVRRGRARGEGKLRRGAVSGKSSASMPSALSAFAAASANGREKWRVSCEMTTLSFWPG